MHHAFIEINKINNQYNSSRFYLLDTGLVVNLKVKFINIPFSCMWIPPMMYLAIDITKMLPFTEMHRLMELRERNDKMSGRLNKNRSRDFTLKQEQVEVSAMQTVLLCY